VVFDYVIASVTSNSMGITLLNKKVFVEYCDPCSYYILFLSVYFFRFIFV